MKIGFVMRSLCAGGAERAGSILCNEWAKNNDVILFLTSTRLPDAYLLSPKIKRIYLSEEKNVSIFRKNQILKELVKKEGCDVLAAFLDPCTWYASNAAKHCHIPCICSERNDPNRYPKNRGLRVLRRIAYSNSDAIVFQTESAKNFFPKNISEKGEIIPNPIDDHFLNAKRNSLSIRKQILFVGRNNEQKNFPLLVEAFGAFVVRHPDYSLCILSNSEEYTFSRFYFSKPFSKCISFQGFQPNVWDFLQTTGIFVLPSNYEGMPNSLLEALAVGVPSVSTDCPCGGPRALLANSSAGILTPTNDPKAFAQAMTTIAENYGSFNEHASLYSRQIKSLYNSSHIANRWIDLFEKSLAKNTR